MKLAHQLFLLLASLVLLLFIGTLTISLSGTRVYLESQLASHAQDAATSLGLSASAPVVEQDRALVVALVNAMFHRGDYLSIRVEDLQGRDWVERIAELDVDGVPAWFRRLAPLSPPQRDATVLSGWRQVGRVVVTSHPGLAYRQLWQSAIATLQLFGAGALSALLIGWLGVRLILRPLARVETQAAAICERRFPVLDQLPFTLELKRVVEAMNRLSQRVSRMLADAEQLATTLRQQAYQDPVTGLANRRQFMDVLAHRVADRQQMVQGGLLLLQLNGFKAFNQTRGYPEGDRLLAATGAAIAVALEGEPHATLAHLSGADFAVLLENADAAQVAKLGEAVTASVAKLAGHFALASADVAHLGGELYSGQPASALLAGADMALRTAQRQGANAAVIGAPGSPSGRVRGASEWRELIEAALVGRRFTLLRQPVIAARDQTLLHHEVFLRLPDPQHPGQDIAAAVFMPLAEANGLAPQIDRAVIEAVVVGIEAGTYPGRVAVNLSPTSLATPGMLDWFATTLARHAAAAGRLVLEVPEYGAAAAGGGLGAWIERLAPLGVGFALDHFGKGFSAFSYLRGLAVDYLKVDGSFVHGIAGHPDNRFFLRAVAEIAHGLDMQVVAESVESERDWQTVVGLGIDAGRGVWLGAPE